MNNTEFLFSCNYFNGALVNYDSRLEPPNSTPATCELTRGVKRCSEEAFSKENLATANLESDEYPLKKIRKRATYSSPRLECSNPLPFPLPLSPPYIPTEHTEKATKVASAIFQPNNFSEKQMRKDLLAIQTAEARKPEEDLVLPVINESEIFNPTRIIASLVTQQLTALKVGTLSSVGSLTITTKELISYLFDIPLSLVSDGTTEQFFDFNTLHIKNTLNNGINNDFISRMNKLISLFVPVYDKSSFNPDYQLFLDLPQGKCLEFFIKRSEFFSESITTAAFEQLYLSKNQTLPVSYYKIIMKEYEGEQEALLELRLDSFGSICDLVHLHKGAFTSGNESLSIFKFFEAWLNFESLYIHDDSHIKIPLEASGRKKKATHKKMHLRALLSLVEDQTLYEKKLGVQLANCQDLVFVDNSKKKPKPFIVSQIRDYYIAAKRKIQTMCISQAIETVLKDKRSKKSQLLEIVNRYYLEVDLNKISLQNLGTTLYKSSRSAENKEKGKQASDDLHFFYETFIELSSGLRNDTLEKYRYNMALDVLRCGILWAKGPEISSLETLASEPTIDFDSIVTDLSDEMSWDKIVKRHYEVNRTAYSAVA